LKQFLYRKLIRFTVFGLILLFFAVVYILAFHTYRQKPTEQLDYDHDGIINVKDNDIDGDGTDNLTDKDSDGDGIDNMTDIISNTRDLKGILYDQLQGRLNNIGGKFGLIVCIDVPRIAYANAGIYIEKLMNEDYKANKTKYDSRNGTNTPNTQFFFRRVSNLFVYCRNSNKLIEKCLVPRIGDIVFYGTGHVTLVSDVHNDGTYDELETHPGTIVVIEHKNKKWVPRNVGRILQ